MSLQEIAAEVQNESKWKQLGELAMSTGKVCYVIIAFSVPISNSPEMKLQNLCRFMPRYISKIILSK